MDRNIVVFDNQDEFVYRYTIIKNNGDAFVTNTSPLSFPKVLHGYDGNVLKGDNTVEDLIRDAIIDPKKFGKIVKDNALIGKKIKLYEVELKGGFITDKNDLSHPKDKIIGETEGTIVSIETEVIQYEGDYYNIKVVDNEGKELNVTNLNSITTVIEIIES